jgi:hypothetical protein
VHRRDPGVEALAIAFATSVAVYDPALVPNLSTNISCVAAAWALIDDHGPPDERVDHMERDDERYPTTVEGSVRLIDSY